MKPITKIHECYCPTCHPFTLGRLFSKAWQQVKRGGNFILERVPLLLILFLCASILAWAIAYVWDI